MSQLTVDDITRLRRGGLSIAEIAAEHDVGPGAIYQTLRRAGVSARAAAQPKKRGVKYRPVPRRPGYRVGDDGSVQTCVSPRTGDQTDVWRDLTVAYAQGAYPFVSIGNSASADRWRPSLRKLLADAWGESAGRKIYDRVYGE